MAKLTPKKTTKAKRATRPASGRASGSPRPAAKAAPKAPAKTARRPALPIRASAPASLAVRRSTAPRPDAPRTNPPAAPVKPAKNLAGLKPRDLAFFRDLLLAKRRELVGDVHSMEQEALQTSGGSNLSNLPIHMADMGTDNYEQEFTLGLVEKDRQLLREINTALAKIRDGTYGMCEGTNKPISRARLEAQPWARFSIEHARRVEQGMMARP